MKHDQPDKELMDYIDGLSIDSKNINTVNEGEEIKEIVSGLKRLSLQKISQETDKRLYQFIEKQNPHSKKGPSLKRVLSYITVAASIIILLFNISYRSSLKRDYLAISSNPDKLSFIYKLNNQPLKAKEVEWLKELLKTEKNPNIKITIVDLLNQHKSKLDKAFFNHIQNENFPTVQMALLNTIEASENLNYRSELLSFMSRKGLENAVQLKVKEMLSSQ